MDKYQKTIIAIVLVIAILSISYAILIISEILGSFNLGIPFFILMPSWLPAIWIPIIEKKRQEQLKQQNQLKEQIGV